jgi:hypothetical protein
MGLGTGSHAEVYRYQRFPCDEMPRSIFLALAVALVTGGCLGGSEQEGGTKPSGNLTATRSPMVQQQPVGKPCPVTRPNGRVPPGETASPGSRYLGNGDLWTDLYPNPIRPRPEDIRANGAIEIKVPWWRGVTGRLSIDGRRLDALAPPLSAWIPGGYGRRGFQSTAITFPTAGCWQVTGRVGAATLAFVSLILEPA